ncbi:MAG: GlsB/YeaQ/YmgE family stress response membrane protein [Pirellulales bacterium]|nr:GlsB/YeaQ/YmgE family stress response membrane protein [Pirellulales bacterium]
MTIWQIFLLLLIAGICGSLGQAIAGGGSRGCLVSIVLGFIGAMLGLWLSRLMGLPELFTVEIGDEPFPIVWSIIGAAIFVAVLSLFTRRGRGE